MRQKPQKIEDAAAHLARESKVPVEQCAAAIRATWEAGSQAIHPVTQRPLFAFRLHQFLSKGDTVHVTVEDKGYRHLTRDYQREQPGSGGKILIPLAFCRECGQEYLTVWRSTKGGDTVHEPRPATAGTGGGADGGYLYIEPDHPGRRLSKTPSLSAASPSRGWRPMITDRSRSRRATGTGCPGR